MTLQLGNYKEEVINKTSFTIQEYITKHRLSKTRIYLMSKRKSHAEIMNEIAQSTFRFESDDGNDFTLPAPFTTNSNVNTEFLDIEKSFDTGTTYDLLGELNPPTYFNNDVDVLGHHSLFQDNTLQLPPSLDSIATLDQSSLNTSQSVSNLVNTELVNDSVFGTSEEREHLLSEIKDSYTQSLQKDKDKENEHLYSQNKTTEELETSETAIHLQLQRKRRVIPGPDVICFSVRHPDLGTIRRLFKENVTMNYCYDWVGSLHKYPMHFCLIDPKGTSVDPSWKAKDFGQVVLNVQTIQEPLLFEDDGEISIPAFGTNVVNLELKRRQQEENASGDGVTKDVYVHFYNEILSLHSAGIKANEPTKLSEEEYETLGKIVTHAFIQYNIFPIQLSKPFFEQVVTDSVRESVLVDSFKDFILPKEKAVIEKL